MTQARLLVREFQRRYSRVGEDSSRRLGTADICSFINQAIGIYFENRASLYGQLNSVKKELLPFEIRFKELQPKKVFRNYVLFDIPNNYHTFIEAQVSITPKNIDHCNSKVADVYLVPSDKTNSLLRDPFWKPSYQYEETFANESSDGLHVFYDPSDHTISDFVLSYLFRPTQIQCPSAHEDGEYVGYDGKVYKRDVNTEFNNPASISRICDIAFVLASTDQQDHNSSQAQITKILQLDQIHLT